MGPRGFVSRSAGITNPGRCDIFIMLSCTFCIIQLTLCVNCRMRLWLPLYCDASVMVDRLSLKRGVGLSWGKPNSSKMFLYHTMSHVASTAAVSSDSVDELLMLGCLWLRA